MTNKQGSKVEEGGSNRERAFRFLDAVIEHCENVVKGMGIHEIKLGCQHSDTSTHGHRGTPTQYTPMRG